MNPPARKIIHIDCDCFFAAVEMRDHPEWRDVPLAVGGAPAARGVIATCNYPARAFGIHSAMPSAQALKRCPHLVLVPGDMARYREASQAVRAVFERFTSLIEPVSLDEAYLDVSGQPHCQGSATRMAEAIRAAIRHEVGITASAGIAPNKMLAKIASDWNKPDGQWLIRPQDIAEFMPSLPVHKLNGVGPATAARLAALGVSTCGQLQQLPLAELAQRFGRFGERLHQMARGEDARPVRSERVRKSLSVERTYPVDLPDLAACAAQLPSLLAALTARLAPWLASGGQFRGAWVKVRFADFHHTTVEDIHAPLTEPALHALLVQALARGGQPVRLLGVGVRLMPPAAPHSGRHSPQLELFA